MSEKNDKELYLNFDEYIRQGEPRKKERAEAEQLIEKLEELTKEGVQ